MSITSAFYNPGAALINMIDSIRAQTFDDWELILLDDGSTDNSLTLARSVRDHRVRVEVNERNLGRSASLNRLSRLARGRYIARMDADDMSAPTRIEKQVNYLETHGQIDVVGTAALYIDRDDRPLGWQPVPPDHAAICRHPSRMFSIVHGSLLARRAWFDKFSYDERLRISVDSNLFFRSHDRSTFANLVEPLYYYRFEPSFTLRKQCQARRASARYLFELHRQAGRCDRALLHWAIQHAKLTITLAGCMLGLRRRLMARRFHPLSDQQLQDYSAALRRIAETRSIAPTGEVPGP